jgi:hypothetical protein
MNAAKEYTMKPTASPSAITKIKLANSQLKHIGSQPFAANAAPTLKFHRTIPPTGESQFGKRNMAAATLKELQLNPTPLEINAALRYFTK